jgi:hypothetical protein
LNIYYYHFGIKNKKTKLMKLAKYSKKTPAKLGKIIPMNLRKTTLREMFGRLWNVLEGFRII